MSGHRIPGLVDTLRPVIDAFRRIGDALAGVDVIADDNVPIGHMVRTGRFLIAHPLDVIAIKHLRDPHARLDEAMEIILEKTLDEFDAAIWRVLR